MTKILFAAAIATLLAMSPAHADDNSFGNGETVSPAYSAPAKSVDDSVDLPTREAPVEVQKSKSAAPKKDAPAPFAWVAEKVLVTFASFAVKPRAGVSVAFAR